MPAQIIIRGLERLQGRFAALGSKFPKFMNDSTKAAVLYVHSQIPKYPAPPPDSEYRRTGTLGRSVTTLMGSNPEALSRVEGSLGGKVSGIVGTKLSYAPWVIDRERQTAGHKKTGWYTLQDVIERLRPQIIEVYNKALNVFITREF